MTFRIARFSLMTLLLLGLVLTSGFLAPPNAFAQIEKVRMGVNGMI